jgi:hypothetical protein
MPSPPIALFMTTIASQPALRRRQGLVTVNSIRRDAHHELRTEYILRILQVKKIPYTAYDLASDEEAKRLWKRKSPTGSYSLNHILFLSEKIQAILLDKQQIPGILVGGKYPGVRLDFELLRNSMRLTIVNILKKDI